MLANVIINSSIRQLLMRQWSLLLIVTENIPMPTDPSVTAKKPSAIKPLCLFNEVFDVKNKTALHRIGADK